MIFNVPLSDDEAASVSTYLLEKYGLVRAALEAVRARPAKAKAAQASVTPAGGSMESAVVVSGRAGAAVGAATVEGAKAEEGAAAVVDEPLDAKCQSGTPFKGSVEEFLPPEKASLADLQKWETALTGMRARVKVFKGGGQLLRDFIHDEVSKLSLLRHKLFCKYVV